MQLKNILVLVEVCMLKLDNFENWSKKIFNELKHNKKKKIILLAGASCSGKSFNAIRLAKQLGCFGKKVAILQSDNYHRSFSLITTENALTKNSFPDIVKQLYPQIVKAVYSCTFNLKTPDKFSNTVIKKLEVELSKLMPKPLATNVLEALKREHICQNIDEPTAIDYKKLADDINCLIDFPSKEIYYPQYMFEFAESSYNADNKLKGEDFDCIIVEGMYVLRPELLRFLDEKIIIKAAVNCEVPTMLTRLLNRKAGSQEQIIASFISKTMPAYFRFIHPTLLQASCILNSTPEVDVDNMKKWQEKFMVDKATIDTIIEKNSIKLLSKTSQIDFLLEYVNPKLNEHIDITLRRENNVLSKLTMKSKTVEKKTEIDNYSEFDIMSILNDNTKNVNFLIKTFSSVRYVPTILIRKERKIYEYNNTKFKLDFVPELGWFVELFPCPPKEEKAIRKLLNLNNPKAETYFDIYKQEVIQKEHQLKAIQFKVENVDKEKLEHEFLKLDIKKTLLDFANQKLHKKLVDEFKSELDFSLLGECYIEQSKIGANLIMLDSEEGRVFFKQKIEPESAQKLISQFGVKTIDIVRYDITRSLYFTVRLDKNEQNDYTIRIRFDRNQYTEESAVAFAKTFLNDKIEFIPIKKYTPFSASVQKSTKTKKTSSAKPKTKKERKTK